MLNTLGRDTELCITQLEKATGIRNLLPVINRLLERGALSIKEELKRSYKPRTEAFIRLAETVKSEDDLHRLFDALSRAPKQLAALMKYVELSGWVRPGCFLKEVPRKTLLQEANVASTIVSGLVEKHIFELYHQEVGRLARGTADTVPLNPLSEAQQKAYDAIMQAFASKQTCLLHGVTSSGKTEIYIHLIEQAIRAGKQVLYLLPEIALTTQITERLRRVFGNRLGIYHSKFPDAERVEIWQKQLSEHDYDVILGVRSSVFLPFRRLGLVIVDEEHENTYKQQEPAPRYHARNAAMVLASMFGAKTLLGTATPSIETYYNAVQGKYGFVQLTERHRRIQLPEIEVVDIKELVRKKRMTAQFSPLLLQKIREALEQKEQVILFQNRRGFAPMIECRTCGWVPKCRNCDVSLTYHKGLNQLACHYCGYTEQVPKSCPACGGTELMSRGFGTEKVEDSIKELFSRSPDCPHGFGYDPYPHGIRENHIRFRRRENGYPYRDADGIERTGLRPGQRSGYPECRLDAELSRLPLLRACLPADGTSGRACRTQKQTRTGRAADQTTRFASDTRSGDKRLPTDVRRTDRRTEHVPLSAFLPADLCISQAPEARGARPGCRPDGKRLASRLGRTGIGTGFASGFPHPDLVHQEDNRESGTTGFAIESADVLAPSAAHDDRRRAFPFLISIL